MDIEDLKICTRCNTVKSGSKDFYMCLGKYRSECKQCTIEKNVNYQKKTQAWKHRFVDEKQTRSYMQEYYATHKKKFEDYRTKFKEKYPNYFKEYSRRKKKDEE